MVLASLYLMEDFLCVGGKLSLPIRSIQWPDLAALGVVVSITGSFDELWLSYSL